MSNVSTRVTLKTHNGIHQFRVLARVARNGGAHGSPFDIEVTEILMMARDRYSVLARYDRAALEYLLEELNGQTWSWLEERLIDAYAESEVAA